ncbi:MAG: hypothetical protein CFE27_12960 [Alphaproteobacteria bacterium PA1]|nr:MAG: hypothetical protein CFE27_12960 [Alphaproteobacteria bacterium PA1]
MGDKFLFVPAKDRAARAAPVNAYRCAALAARSPSPPPISQWESALAFALALLPAAKAFLVETTKPKTAANENGAFLTERTLRPTLRRACKPVLTALTIWQTMACKKRKVTRMTATWEA